MQFAEGNAYLYQASQNRADLETERESKSSDSNQGLAGVDVFFAKQLLKRHPPAQHSEKVLPRSSLFFSSGLL